MWNSLTGYLGVGGTLCWEAFLLVPLIWEPYAYFFPWEDGDAAGVGG